MIRIDRPVAAMAALALAVASPARAEEKAAAAMVAEIDAVKMPQLAAADRSRPEAVKAFQAESRRIMDEKSGRIGELYRAHPDCPDLVRLLPMKWRFGQAVPAQAARDKAEVDAILAADRSSKLYPEAAYFAASAAVGMAGPGAKFDQIMPIAETFIGRAPGDPRGARLLAMAAGLADDPKRGDEIRKRIEADFPDSPTARMMAGERRRAEGVGKPVELEFAEATTGTTVSIKGLKGKVVVIDFWATWCGPCLQEMPTMKKLYAAYKDKGVEFIGVSLDVPVDQGGLDKLKAYVAKNDIGWPQFYQGKGWEGDFSRSWGINSIPCVFLVDADGNLASTEARGELETMIPEYLRKAEGARDAK